MKVEYDLSDFYRRVSFFEILRVIEQTCLQEIIWEEKVEEIKEARVTDGTSNYLIIKDERLDLGWIEIIPVAI